MTDYYLPIQGKTTTGNECAYFLTGHHGINAPVWEFPIGPDSIEDLQHAEALEIDRTEFPNIHAHWSYEARDCDGGHGDYGIYRPIESEYTELGSVDVYEFWSRVVSLTMSVYAAAGTLKVTGADEAYGYRVEWTESTEEGYRYREAYLCTDDCDEPRNTVYDQYAQMMGY